jgi:hypothetical protein
MLYGLFGEALLKILHESALRGGTTVWPSSRSFAAIDSIPPGYFALISPPALSVRQ